MTGTDAVLAAIDHALEDYDTSEDAMRWTPEPPPVRVPSIYLPMFTLPTGTSVAEAVQRMVRISTQFAAAMEPAMERAGRELGQLVRGLRPDRVIIDEPFPLLLDPSFIFASNRGDPFRLRRVEEARTRRVASMLRHRDRRVARRRMARA